ncbi:MAG: hypothetical protein ACD_46C00503G0001 [uncultured bacterium]|nr:MAG: hypothetical protein ACD_46C00503G0001 [uncultured bacterium]
MASRAEIPKNSASNKSTLDKKPPDNGSQIILFKTFIGSFSVFVQRKSGIGVIQSFKSIKFFHKSSKLSASG